LKIRLRGGVDIRNGFGPHKHSFGGAGCIGHRIQDVLVKSLRVGKEERRIPAEQKQARNDSGFGMSLDVVITVEFLDEAFSRCLKLCLSAGPTSVER